MLPFGVRNHTFHRPKGYLLQGKTIPLAQPFFVLRSGLLVARVGKSMLSVGQVVFCSGCPMVSGLDKSVFSVGQVCSVLVIPWSLARANPCFRPNGAPAWLCHVCAYAGYTPTPWAETVCCLTLCRLVLNRYALTMWRAPLLSSYATLVLMAAASEDGRMLPLSRGHAMLVVMAGGRCVVARL